MSLTARQLYAGLAAGQYTDPLTEDFRWTANDHAERKKAYTRWELYSRPGPLSSSELLYGLSNGAFFMFDDLRNDPLWTSSDIGDREAAYGVWVEHLGGGSSPVSEQELGGLMMNLAKQGASAEVAATTKSCDDDRKFLVRGVKGPKQAKTGTTATYEVTKVLLTETGVSAGPSDLCALEQRSIKWALFVEGLRVDLEQVGVSLALEIEPVMHNVAVEGKTIRLRPFVSSPTPDIEVATRVTDPCVEYTLAQPRVIAVALDGAIVEEVRLRVPEDAPYDTLAFGPDATSSSSGSAGDYAVGDTEQECGQIMRFLLGQFASGDTSGVAERLIDAFIAGSDAIRLFKDPDLDLKISESPRFNDFSELVVSAPGTEGASRFRLHQALEQANWDINAVTTITDLGIPAFNEGNSFWGTKNWGDGLALMINGVQYVVVYAEAYEYDACKKRYTLELRFVFYDVFGLDDDDLREYGTTNGGWGTTAARGISAWWQLQFEYGHRPLLTRAEVRRTYEVDVGQ